MSLDRLKELSTYLPQSTTQVDTSIVEARDTSSDLDGIKSVVDDCLADLSEKIGKGGALADLMKSSGADKLDTVKDKDGLTMSAKLAKLVVDFKKEVEKTMTEVELMVTSTTPTKMNEGLLNEGKDYSDSGEFTEELFAVGAHIQDMKKIVRMPRWNAWMVSTDHNFGTTSVSLSNDFATKLSELDKAFDALEDELHSAS
jgi:hypothetical protein